MAVAIQHIDKIARDKNRDVLFIEFDREIFPDRDFESWEKRNELIAWLDKHAIPYQMCGPIAREDG